MFCSHEVATEFSRGSVLDATNDVGAEPMMSLKELESTIAQLPQNEKAELLRFLTRELRLDELREDRI